MQQLCLLFVCKHPLQSENQRKVSCNFHRSPLLPLLIDVLSIITTIISSLLPHCFHIQGNGSDHRSLHEIGHNYDSMHDFFQFLIPLDAQSTWPHIQYPGASFPL